ncbi:MAG TPA: signal recognition particle-docking protein FtsY, partial [Verrucomicrobiae bacterium]
MADPIPDPVPPKPPEAAKVQPKKETVRIALPPKPTAAPTIKLPSLPPTGAAPATAAPSVARPVAAAPTTQIPRPASAPTAAAPAATAARPGTAV